MSVEKSPYSEYEPILIAKLSKQIFLRKVTLIGPPKYKGRNLGTQITNAFVKVCNIQFSMQFCILFTLRYIV